MKLIKRYNRYVQQIIKAKTTPEPWLHVLIVPTSSVNSANFVWCIYVWDTRKVIESGKGSSSSFKYFGNAPDAVDNREPLVGLQKDDILYKAMSRQAKPYVEKPKSAEPTSDDLGFEKHRGMAILRYNNRVRSKLGTKTEGAPYLHIAFFTIPTQSKAYYVIYVWDSRAILEEGTCTLDQKDNAYDVTDYVTDSHKPLRGSSEGAKRFNYSAFKMAKEQQGLEMAGVPKSLQNMQVRYYMSNSLPKDFQFIKNAKAYHTTKFAMIDNGMVLALTYFWHDRKVIDARLVKAYPQFGRLTNKGAKLPMDFSNVNAVANVKGDNVIVITGDDADTLATDATSLGALLGLDITAHYPDKYSFKTKLSKRQIARIAHAMELSLHIDQDMSSE